MCSVAWLSIFQNDEARRSLQRAWLQLSEQFGTAQLSFHVQIRLRGQHQSKMNIISYNRTGVVGGGEQISVVTVVKWQWIRASQVKAFPFLCHASCPSLFSLGGRRRVKTCDASLLLIVGHLFLRSNVAPFRMWWCVDHLFLPRHHSSQSIRY